MTNEERSEHTTPREVARAADLFEARLLAGYLESHGIPTHIPGESVLDTLDGMAAIWSRGVPVEVPSDRAEEARRLLAERAESDPE